MGDIADAIINGDFDAESGEWLGDGHGFPRVQRNGKIVGQHNENYGENPYKGIRKYLNGKGITQPKRQRELMEGFTGEKQKSNKELSEIITLDFNGFVKYVNKNK